jgi:hypothetical protein
MALHATGIAFMAFATVHIRRRVGTGMHPSLLPMLAVMIVIGVAGLLLAVLHGVEAALWAAAYRWLGALHSPAEAFLYSVDSISTRDASGLILERHWRMMGALEAVDGMLLFGISTTYIFTVMQAYRSMMRHL